MFVTDLVAKRTIANLSVSKNCSNDELALNNLNSSEFDQVGHGKLCHGERVRSICVHVGQ